MSLSISRHLEAYNRVAAEQAGTKQAFGVD
jgi:hypothetical protein